MRFLKTQVLSMGFYRSSLPTCNEIISLSSRHQHRIVYASMLRDRLIEGGVTVEQQKQIASWMEPLTAY
jgi:hypothetical protein